MALVMAIIAVDVSITDVIVGDDMAVTIAGTVIMIAVAMTMMAGMIVMAALIAVLSMDKILTVVSQCRTEATCAVAQAAKWARMY
jgi:hypothetical protein